MSDAPYFAETGDGVTAEDAAREARRLRQQRYRARKKTEAMSSSSTSSSSTGVDGVDIPVDAPRSNVDGDKRNATKTPTKRNASRKLRGASTVLSAQQYADVFQGLHGIAAGVTGVVGLAITEDEAKPVGDGLKLCADYYGWDFVERFGPVFVLGLSLTTLEMKVALRATAEIKAGGGRRGRKRQEQQTQPVPQPPQMAPEPSQGWSPPPAPLNPSEGRGAALLALLEEEVVNGPDVAPPIAEMDPVPHA
jgi:hypothetical protein